MYVVSVYVTNASLYVDRPFSYACEYPIEKYKRVRVNFGNSNKIIGIVVDCTKCDLSKDEYAKEKGYALQDILEVIDSHSVLDDSLYSLANWLAATTISPLVSCINAMVPKALKTSNNTKASRVIEYLKKNEFTAFKTDKQKDFYDSLSDGMECSAARKISSSMFNTLVKYGAISIYEDEKKYQPTFIPQNAFKDLTEEQQNVYRSFLSTDKMVSLLFGVTGSGKTEVYLHLTREYLNKGKEVLILVPEISLTPQMIQRVKERFNDVVFYHSELSDQEKYEQYMRIKNHEVPIVVGTRSSIFLPFHDLGLIIIDEEHDSSYKQDSTPCYSVKNVAIRRAIEHGAKVLLASATPSLDSYTRAKKGDYLLLELKHRINNTLPEILTVDLNKEIKRRGSYIISSKLKEEITNTLNKGKQAIIVLNRRGYSPVVKCKDCGSTLMCSDCDMPLNYHKDENILKCHQCGRTYPLTSRCPSCGSNKLLFYGFGTKKVEEELNSLFPNANIDRMDRDNTTRKGSHQAILSRLENHEIDILVGTQMIAKGLDYPDVTLVGILNADSGLMRQDYNAAKASLDLLMQASGRSGRSSTPGKVIIQTFNDSHYVIKSVLKQDFEYFYNIEMNYRHKTSYPPYAHLISIVVEDLNQSRSIDGASIIYDDVVKEGLKTYQPFALSKLSSLYRTRVLISGKSLVEMINKVNPIIRKYLQKATGARVKVDIDPLYLE